MSKMDEHVQDLLKQRSQIQEARKHEESLTNWNFDDGKVYKHWVLESADYHTTMSGVPGKNCEPNSSLPFTPEPPNLVFRSVGSMAWDSSRGDYFCSICGRRWDEHYHARAIWVERDQSQSNLASSDQRRLFYDAESEDERATLLLEDIKAQRIQVMDNAKESERILRDLLQEYDKICLQSNFSHYLQTEIDLLDSILESPRTTEQISRNAREKRTEVQGQLEAIWSLTHRKDTLLYPRRVEL